MLSFRQIASVVWTFMLFMVAGALVMNLRYKSLDEGDALYLDTWTGKVHSAAPTVALAETVAPEAPELATSLDGVEIFLLDRLRERDVERQLESTRARLDRLRLRLENVVVEPGCQSIRFAFPAHVEH
jgi:hypothetical protein